MSSEGNTGYGDSQEAPERAAGDQRPYQYDPAGTERSPGAWDVPSVPADPEPYLGSSVVGPQPGLGDSPGNGFSLGTPAEPSPGQVPTGVGTLGEPPEIGVPDGPPPTEQNPETGWNTPSQAEPGGSSGWQPPSAPWQPSAPPAPPSSSRIIAIAIVVAALVGAAAGYFAGNGNGKGGGQSTIVEKFSQNTSSLTKMSDPQSVIQKVIPALVSISTQSVQQNTNPFGFGLSPFGGTGGGGSTVVAGAGTGMIITPDGEVITNNHVVAGATTVSVTLYGQTKSIPATIIGTDPSQDLALIKIQNESNLPTVSFGDSSKLEVGDSVLAIGNALDLDGGLSVTEGIISAMNRTIQAGDASSSATENLSGLIQTDAAINSGNSGGALVNSSGQVIGMNTAVASSSSGNAPAQNVGFAIASNHIQQYIPQLQKGGTINSSTGNAYMGVQLTDVDSQIQQQFGLSATSGAFVAQVVPGSPADQGGVRGGDVITSIDGQTVNAAQDVSNIIQGDKPGQKISVQLQRGANQLTVQVTLGTAPTSSS